MNHVKLIVTDENGDTESMWCVVIGDNEYQIDNIPFLSYNLSKGDIVSAEDIDGVLHLVKVIHKSVHRTLWADCDAIGGLASQTSAQLKKFLSDLGSASEGLDPYLLAIDVPPNVDIDTVTRQLDAYGIEWEQGDPNSSVQNHYV